MRLCHWLGSVLCVPFSALTLMVAWQEGHPAIKTQTGGEGGPKGELGPGSAGKTAIKITEVVVVCNHLFFKGFSKAVK